MGHADAELKAMVGEGLISTGGKARMILTPNAQMEHEHRAPFAADDRPGGPCAGAL
jgi:hypothetical protein